jgi:hypothetical protein
MLRMLQICVTAIACRSMMPRFASAYPDEITSSAAALHAVAHRSMHHLSMQKFT